MTLPGNTRGYIFCRYSLPFDNAVNCNTSSFVLGSFETTLTGYRTKKILISPCCNYCVVCMYISCQQLELWQEKCQSESETANWILANTKKCPKCSARIEKNQGKMFGSSTSCTVMAILIVSVLLFCAARMQSHHLQGLQV